MDQSQKIILTPFSFFGWKVEMEIILRVKGIYRVTMTTDLEPNANTNKIKDSLSQRTKRPITQYNSKY